jgi:hypothetical protein
MSIKQPLFSFYFIFIIIFFYKTVAYTYMLGLSDF